TGDRALSTRSPRKGGRRSPPTSPVWSRSSRQPNMPGRRATPSQRVPPQAPSLRRGGGAVEALLPRSISKPIDPNPFVPSIIALSHKVLSEATDVPTHSLLRYAAEAGDPHDHRGPDSPHPQERPGVRHA